MLVVTTAIPAHSLNATQPVRGLVAGGARVLWSTTPSLAAQAARHGAHPVPPVPEPPRLGVADETHGALRGLRQVRRMYRDDLAAPVEAQVLHLLGLVEEHHVDVILSDTLMFGSGNAAEVAGCAWVTLGDGPLARPDPLIPPLGTGLWLMDGPAGRHRNRTVKRISDRMVFAPGWFPPASVPGQAAATCPACGPSAG